MVFATRLGSQAGATSKKNFRLPFSISLTRYVTFMVIMVYLLALSHDPVDMDVARIMMLSANTTWNLPPTNDGLFVISMQDTPGVDKRNQGRLDAFKKKWEEQCGVSMNFEYCPGVFDSRRGYGPTLSFLLCLEKAKEMNLNVTVIFEDDARLHHEGLVLCNETERQGYLWSNLPSDTFVAFLGGHSWVYPESDNVRNNISSGSASLVYQYRQVLSSNGAYGFAVPRESLPLLFDTLKSDIVNGHRDESGTHEHHNFLEPETTIHRAARAYAKKIYAVDPLLVWHEGGFSNTWKKVRGDIRGHETNAHDQTGCPVGVTCK